LALPYKGLNQTANRLGPCLFKKLGGEHEVVPLLLDQRMFGDPAFHHPQRQ
jgi:hypothetical protein